MIPAAKSEPLPLPAAGVDHRGLMMQIFQNNIEYNSILLCAVFNMANFLCVFQKYGAQKVQNIKDDLQWESKWWTPEQQKDAKDSKASWKAFKTEVGQPLSPFAFLSVVCRKIRLKEEWSVLAECEVSCETGREELSGEGCHFCACSFIKGTTTHSVFLPYSSLVLNH